jgi:protein subunit release factor A
MTIVIISEAILILVIWWLYIELEDKYNLLVKENSDFRVEKNNREWEKLRNIEADNEMVMIRDAKIANLEKENEDLKAEIGKILLEKHDRRNKSKS